MICLNTATTKNILLKIGKPFNLSGLNRTINKLPSKVHNMAAV